MCDKVDGFYLIALKFVPDSIVTNSMIDKLNGAVFSDDYIVFGDLDSRFRFRI